MLRDREERGERSGARRGWRESRFLDVEFDQKNSSKPHSKLPSKAPPPPPETIFHIYSSKCVIPLYKCQLLPVSSKSSKKRSHTRAKLSASTLRTPAWFRRVQSPTPPPPPFNCLNPLITNCATIFSQRSSYQRPTPALPCHKSTFF